MKRPNWRPANSSILWKNSHTDWRVLMCMAAMAYTPMSEPEVSNKITFSCVCALPGCLSTEPESRIPQSLVVTCECDNARNSLLYRWSVREYICQQTEPSITWPIYFLVHRPWWRADDAWIGEKFFFQRRSCPPPLGGYRKTHAGV